MWATAPNVKASIVSDLQPIGPHDCKNCGGADVMAIFIATSGPFQTPHNPYSEETSHWDSAANGRRGGWWVGKTYTRPCPVCHGKREPITVKQFPTQRKMGMLVHPDTGEILE